MVKSLNRSLAQKARRARQTPEELTALARKMVAARWATKTPEERSKYGKMMLDAREAKRNK